MAERTIGTVTHFFSKISVAGVSLKEPLKVGTPIHIVGHTTDLRMTVDRLQIEHKDVPEAKPGEDVALHVPDRVREHDEVRVES